MTTPKEFFEHGGLNPEMGVSVHDWYAVGSAFLPPLQDNGKVIVGARNLICTDMASYFTMDFAVLPRQGGSTGAADLISLLTRVFEKFGKPHVGVILSHSVWVSSEVMATDPDLKDRGEVLRHYGITFPEMSLAEKDSIFKWIVAKGLRCEFDADNVGHSCSPLIRVVQTSRQRRASAGTKRGSTGAAIDAATKLIMDRWGNKTLSMLRDEAKREANGTAFESVRLADGKRLFLVLCATEPEEITKLRRVFDFVGEETGLNAETLTLADMILKTGLGTGLSYEAVTSANGNWDALVLCAANPEAVELLESVFAFPK